MKINREETHIIKQTAMFCHDEVVEMLKEHIAKELGVEKSDLSDLIFGGEHHYGFCLDLVVSTSQETKI